ncbi:hypothetical protein BH11ACT3_BH11ACT3_11620 [soil metagenome]
MPQNYSSASSKPGSRSAKHRGHRPDDAPAAGNGAAKDNKKPRWNSDERAVRGHAPERPRGGDTRGDARGAAPRGAGARGGAARASDGRPNWEPREKPASSWNRNTTDRAPRGNDDRPARSYDRDARPARSNDRDDRPARAFNRDDRPARTFDRDARAPRTFDRDARPARSNDRDDRPARTFDRDARPARDASRDDRRPGRTSALGSRPSRESGSSYSSTAPARSLDRDSRPQTRSWDRDNAPRRDSNDRAPRVHQYDVVLERLDAQAIEAVDVDGISFGKLGLGDNIVRALLDLGAASPFPIQAATIPDVLAGRDVLGRGRTGSGKTIAFGAPLVERLLQMGKSASATERREFGRKPRALILAPTRELALQIDRTVQPIARSVGLFTTQIYGGVPYARQLGALQRGVDIIVGTPGRVQDLVTQGRLDLSGVVITVLDEADHMAELGFLEPVQDILNHTKDGGQKLLFSATLDRGVADIVAQYLVNPAVYEVAGEDQASSTIEHRVLLMDQRDKQQVLIELASGPGKKLVFARTRAFAEMLADILDEAGIRAESIHGDLNQSRRTRALEKLTSGRVDVLVATDVAARGIHVDDITLVIQADAPDEYKSYLHRSGRTGRAGKTGTVVTLVPRNRRRRTEELLQRADIVAEWISVVPGDAVISELAGN